MLTFFVLYVKLKLAKNFQKDVLTLNEILKEIGLIGIVPVVKIDNAEDAVPLATIKSNERALAPIFRIKNSSSILPAERRSLLSSSLLIQPPSMANNRQAAVKTGRKTDRSP